MFTAGALAALASETTTEDVAVARRFLNDHLARMAALRIIAAKGTAMDVNDLMEIARSGFGNERKLALAAVQRLAADKLETAKTLVASEGREMRRAALPLVGGLADGLADENASPFLEELLSHDDEDLRIAAIGQLRKRLDQERLADLLCNYTHRGGYFYNVVAWLDRVIYAPAPIRSYYEAELEKKLEAMGH